MREQLMGEIKGLREDYKNQKAQAKEMFNEKYAQEMDKIKGSGEFAKAKGKKGRKKGSKNKSKKK